jgi:solute carrier family 25 oxoglutarate transporter 11
MQPGFVPMNFFKFASKNVREKGAMSLYNGLSAGITRQIFYATSRFGLFEVFRDKIGEYRTVGIAERVAAGLLSGASAALVSCPAEVRRRDQAMARVSLRVRVSGRLPRQCSGVAHAHLTMPGPQPLHNRSQVSLVRMSNDASLPMESRRNYKGVTDCAVRIAREEGVATFWRGSAPFVNRAMLVGVTQVRPALAQGRHHIPCIAQ